MNPAQAQTPAASNIPTTNSTPCFNVTTYVVDDNGLLPTNISAPALSKYTGAKVSLQEIVNAASDLQSEYTSHGYPHTSIAVAQEQITNGIVTLNIFQTAIPQIVVSGIRYSCPTNAAIASGLPAIAPVLVPQTTPAPTATNTPPPVKPIPIAPATPAQIAQARAAVIQQMADLDKTENDTRIHVVSTNTGPRFTVERYRIMGNSALKPQDMAMILTNIDGAYGTNVSIDGVRTVVQELQKAYRDRGYFTVAVGLPQQKLTNTTVKVQVTEGWLEAINVKGNRYFSSNNVMRALPSLHTNILLNQNIFQTELNRANANQDRQIYPVVGPGPDPGSSALTLTVKDQLPIHGKIDLDNENTPGTPKLRVNSSAVDDNLWQQEHSLGVQYGFSPENFKSGSWNFYDAPIIANYSAFYRLPLSSPEAIENTVNDNPRTFGYDEATRHFNLPPPSGQTELNIYASRSTIDTGVQPVSSQVIVDSTNELDTQQTVQEGITINQDIGFQISKPLPEFDGISSTLSGGLDFKTYQQDNYQTNLFTDITITEDKFGNIVKSVNTGAAATPITEENVRYLPLTLSYNANWNNSLGPGLAGLNMSVNLWFSSSTLYTSTSGNPTNSNAQPNIYGRQSLQNITGSTKSTGYWVILKPSFSQNIVSMNNWTTVFRADGQWSSEPLISNEQFGIGGVNSVRGYHEGEIFGDTGWHATLEEQTPQHTVGMVYDGQPMTIQGLAYLDGATAYLLDPQGVPASTQLWGTGLGFSVSVATHWQADFLFSVPLSSTSDITRYQPYFNFSLTGQF